MMSAWSPGLKRVRPVAAAVPRYGGAAAAVGAAFLIRLLLDPWLVDTHAFGAFYPALFLVAHVLGRSPAFFASLLAGFAGSWAFLPPEFDWKTGVDTFAPVVFFAITAWAGIWLIGALRAALERLSEEQGRSKAIADAHAELFKVLHTRIGHDMQLIAGALMLQSRGDSDQQVFAILRRARERSEMIARAHREFAGDEEREVDFRAFAASLARSVCAEAGRPEACVLVRGELAPLRYQVATSLGVALVECLLWAMKRRFTGELRVDLCQDEDGARMLVSNAPQGGGDPITMAPVARMFRAMTDQLGATVRLHSSEDGRAGVEISVPTRSGPAALRPAAPAATATVH